VFEEECIDGKEDGFLAVTQLIYRLLNEA